MTEIRDRLAEALLVWWEADSGDSLRAVPEAIDSSYEYADALMPVVAELVRNEAANALMDVSNRMVNCVDRDLARNRADALRAEKSHRFATGGPVPPNAPGYVVDDDCYRPAKITARRHLSEETP